MPTNQAGPTRSLGRFAPGSCDSAVARAQQVLNDYLDPGSEMSDRACIEHLLAVLDGPLKSAGGGADDDEFVQRLVDEASKDSFPCSDPPAWIARRH